MELKELTRKVTEAVEDGMAWRERLIQVPTPCGHVEVELDYARGEVADVMVFNQRKPDAEYPNIERALMDCLPAPEGYTRYFPTPRWDESWCGFQEY